MSDWDETFDVVIVGSGGGSICAALTAQDAGRSAVIIEKQWHVGGSTAMSGGVAWIPNNHLLKQKGITDSYERARTYMDAVVGDVGPASSPVRRETYLMVGPEMVRYLESKGMKWVHAEGWSDYYDDRPGGEPRGRSLVAELFDVNRLGEWKTRLLRRPAKSNGLVPYPHEGASLLLVTRIWKGKATLANVAVRSLSSRLAGRTLVNAGNALQGRLLEIALRNGIPIWTETPFKAFVRDGARVAGVVAHRNGRDIRIGANLAVLIDSGGFARNLAMREKWQPKPASVAWTNANPGDTGEVLQAAMELGAATDLMDESWWILTSKLPGSLAPPFHTYDISRPHCIVVGKDGRRYMNESASYMELGKSMYERERTVGAVPSFAIMDARHRKKYFWDTVPPGAVPAVWRDSGYWMEAGSLDALAARCGIDAEGLKATVARFNRFAQSGRDEDFHRGERAYDRRHGDPHVRPNPSLGTIEAPPFAAVALYPGDVGTSGGLLTDEYARVLGHDGQPIPHLYATGNCTASVHGRSYPAAGASIGAALVFGYVAMKHATGRN